MSFTVITKIAAATISNPKTCKYIGWTIAIVFSPLILLIVLICSLLNGFSEHNNSAVDLCFNGGIISNKVPAEYREYILDMRYSFELIDDETGKLNIDGENSLDDKKIKAVFYSLFFGSDSPSKREHKKFVECFVTYEERTRTVLVTDENGNETEITETYTVAVPINNMEITYHKIENLMNISVTDENKVNAHEIYSRVSENNF